jgi:hypothetical protein
MRYFKEMYKKIKENRLYLALCSILVILYFIFTSGFFMSLLKKAKIVPMREGYTELYFTEYPKFSQQPEKGEEIEFEYSLHNHTGRNELVRYEVEVYSKTIGGEKRILNQRSVIVPENERRLIKESLLFEEAMASSTVWVMLIDQNQAIHFSLAISKE